MTDEKVLHAWWSDQQADDFRRARMNVGEAFMPRLVRYELADGSGSVLATEVTQAAEPSGLWPDYRYLGVVTRFLGGVAP